MAMPNLTIYPYLYEDACWVFDDKRVRLKEEAFVLGTGEIISGVVEAKAIPNAASGFALTFGVEPFDHDVELNWITPAEAAECAAFSGRLDAPRRQLVSRNNFRPGNGGLALPGSVFVFSRSAEKDLR